MANLPISQPIDGNGRTVEFDGWDSTNNQYVVDESAAGTAAAGQSFAYAPKKVAISSANSGLPATTPTIVQKAGAVSTGSVASLTATFAKNVTAGNSIVVVCGTGDNGTLTVSDSLSNTFTQAVLKANSTTFQSAIYYAVGIAGGADIITVADTSSDSIVIEIYEVSGLIAQVMAQPDSSTSATGTGTTASASNLAPSSPNSLIFAGTAIGTGVVTVVTPGAGFVNDGGVLQPTTPSGLFQFIAMSGYLASTQAITPSVTWTTSRAWSQVAAIFKQVVLGIQGTVTLAGYNYTHITTQTTTLIKTGAGILHSIIINSHAASATIEMDDALTHTSPVIGIVTLPSTITAVIPIALEYDVQFSTGLSITTGVAAPDITVVWK